MKTFILNTYNVVTNPNVYIIYDKNNTSVIIKTAEIDGKWVASSSCQFMPCYVGFSSLPSIFDKKYNTEKEAFIAEINLVKERINKEDKINNLATPYLESADKLHFPTEMQLSLF